MFVYQLSGSGFESRCCHLNLRIKGIESHCLKQNILQRKQYQENEKKKQTTATTKNKKQQDSHANAWETYSYKKN